MINTLPFTDSPPGAEEHTAKITRILVSPNASHLTAASAMTSLPSLSHGG
jgi:hypothetical protein